VKAGALLLIPSLLGVIHYRYGLLMLLYSICIILSVQMILGYPFYITNWKAYWKNSLLEPESMSVKGNGA